MAAAGFWSCRRKTVACGMLIPLTSTTRPSIVAVPESFVRGPAERDWKPNHQIDVATVFAGAQLDGLDLGARAIRQPIGDHHNIVAGRDDLDCLRD